MLRTFSPCREGNCQDCAGVVTQNSERKSEDGSIVEATCTHACHDSEQLAVVGGEAGC